MVLPLRCWQTTQDQRHHRICHRSQRETVEPKYQATLILQMMAGKVHSGLVTAETDQLVTSRSLPPSARDVQTLEIAKSEIEERQISQAEQMKVWREVSLLLPGSAGLSQVVADVAGAPCCDQVTPNFVGDRRTSAGLPISGNLRAVAAFQPIIDDNLRRRRAGPETLCHGGVGRMKGIPRRPSQKDAGHSRAGTDGHRFRCRAASPLVIGSCTPGWGNPDLLLHTAR